MFDKNMLLKSITEPDEKLVYAKAFDQAYYCLTKSAISFTDFLDPYKVSGLLKLFNGNNYSLTLTPFGGHTDCERKIIGFSPDYLNISEDGFPISAIEIKYNSAFSRKLTHRDFLGSILGLGIERKKIGDIILSDGSALVFSYDDIAGYICANLERVSNTKVKTALVSPHDFIYPDDDSIKKRMTVSSLRIDTVLAGIFNISRSKAADYIGAEKVFINWVVVKNAAKTLSEGDSITVRGVGRAKFIGVSGKSKKDKFVIDVTVK